MDFAAKQFLLDCTNAVVPKEYSTVTLMHEKWSVSLNGKKLSLITRDKLYIGLYGPRTLAYWARKDDIPEEPKEIL